MRTIRPLLIAATVFSAGSALAAPVPVLDFPSPGLPYSVTYGDFESYSMPILDWASTSSGGQPYMFNTANTIQDALVIGTGSQTNNQDLGLIGTVQNGFDFPNVQNGTVNYSTTTAVGGPQTFTLQDLGSGSPSAFGHGDYVLSGGPVTLCYNVTFASATAANVVNCGDASVVDSHVFQHNLGQNEVGTPSFPAC